MQVRIRDTVDNERVASSGAESFDSRRRLSFLGTTRNQRLNEEVDADARRLEPTWG